MLPKAAYRWAFKHLSTEGDTDLFPPPFEIEALLSERRALLDLLADVDLTNYAWSQGRRFLVPTAYLSFRSATQLDPLDAIVFAALIRQYGRLIERARVPTGESRVFSYRFSPTSDGRLYGPDSGWQDLWNAAHEAASRDECRYVAVLDIVDFYNQIYHHTIENELIAKGVPKPAVRAILALLGTLTHGGSRGIPVGPHAAHLLAECAMDPVDRSLSARNYTFCRYVDDIFIFCPTRDAAEIAIFECADILDKHQRLALQKKKVEIVAADVFRERAAQMMVNQPMNTEEEALLDRQSPHRRKSLQKHRPGRSHE